MAQLELRMENKHAELNAKLEEMKTPMAKLIELQAVQGGKCCATEPREQRTSLCCWRCSHANKFKVAVQVLGTTIGLEGMAY